MMPRPRARGKDPIRVPDADDLAEQVRKVRQDQGAPPVAIVTGIREWVHMRRQVAFDAHSRFWPGGEETFAGAAVVISRVGREPRVMASQQDLEDALLGG